MPSRKVAENQDLPAECKEYSSVVIGICVAKDRLRFEVVRVEPRRLFRIGGVDVNVIEGFDLQEEIRLFGRMNQSFYHGIGTHSGRQIAGSHPSTTPPVTRILNRGLAALGLATSAAGCLNLARPAGSRRSERQWRWRF